MAMTIQNFTLGKIFAVLIFPSLLETLKMLIISGLLSVFFGFFVGVLLVATDKDGLKPNKVVYQTADIIVNIVRSFPFIILMISIIPLTRFLTGTSIGEMAALVPLTVAATPFMARIFQSSLKEVNPELIEAARSFGASNIQIIWKIMLVEAIPSIISGISLGIINLLGATAMAGAIGAGGLGAAALTYGYQNFNYKIMYSIVIVLILLVILIQFLGDWLYKKLK